MRCSGSPTSNHVISKANYINFRVVHYFPLGELAIVSVEEATMHYSTDDNIIDSYRPSHQLGYKIFSGDTWSGKSYTKVPVV